MEAVASQVRIYEETTPLREELDRVSELLKNKEEEIEVTRKDLFAYQEKIAELESKHTEKKEALQEQLHQELATMSIFYISF